ncbi:hypothetical protein [Haloplanus salilacus]|uniref:hypothetical protein n=1 Tax=Haloplanus salilacus TaxID=2949994 RepID=UPI0030CC8745
MNVRRAGDLPSVLGGKPREPLVDIKEVVRVRVLLDARSGVVLRTRISEIICLPSIRLARLRGILYM